AAAEDAADKSCPKVLVCEDMSTTAEDDGPSHYINPRLVQQPTERTHLVQPEPKCFQHA
ncbi:unnamed protein product, partial [Amoebophrya sp. A120]